MDEIEARFEEDWPIIQALAQEMLLFMRNRVDAAFPEAAYARKWATFASVALLGNEIAQQAVQAMLAEQEL